MDICLDNRNISFGIEMSFKKKKASEKMAIINGQKYVIGWF